MRFIDANVFIYAVLKPRGPLSEEVSRIKQGERSILSRVNSGEEVVTTVVHLSEVANVLEDVAGIKVATSFIRDLMTKENIIVDPVAPKEYLESVLLAEEKRVSVNDALAYLAMRRRGIEEIYTFDKHFERLGVRIVKG